MLFDLHQFPDPSQPPINDPPFGPEPDVPLQDPDPSQNRDAPVREPDSHFFKRRGGGLSLATLASGHPEPSWCPTVVGVNA
jgi:hypothetical protein